MHPETRALCSTPGPLVAQPRVASLPEHKRRQREDMLCSDPEPAPAVHVAIGRVEVRATMPAQSSAKPRSALKAMSLDEYLRQRSGGGRS